LIIIILARATVAFTTATATATETATTANANGNATATAKIANTTLQQQESQNFYDSIELMLYVRSKKIAITIILPMH